MNQCPNCGINLARVDPKAAIGDLTVSLFGECWWKGRHVKLTAMELRVLHVLASTPDTVFTVQALIDATGSSCEFGNTVQVLACRIRGKLVAVDPGFDRLETVRGRGYRYRSDAASCNADAAGV